MASRRVCWSRRHSNRFAAGHERRPSGGPAAMGRSGQIVAGQVEAKRWHWSPATDRDPSHPTSIWCPEQSPPNGLRRQQPKSLLDDLSFGLVEDLRTLFASGRKRLACPRYNFAATSQQMSPCRPLSTVLVLPPFAADGPATALVYICGQGSQSAKFVCIVTI